jgi:hypothetical protein
MTSKLLQTLLYLLALPFVLAYGLVTFTLAAAVSTVTGIRRIWTNAR